MGRLTALAIILLTVAPAKDRLGATCLAQPRVEAPAPPAQPIHGPGSSDYVHGRVVHVRVRSGTQGYHLFEPADPTPETAPVIAFLHGYGATRPLSYRGWIDHLVRRGNIVVYPVYQTSLLTPSAAYTDSAVGAIVDAYRELESESHVRPHPEHFAVLGHSVGGVLAANVAALAEQAGLPAPRAIMLANAGDVQNIFLGFLFESILDDVDYGTIPADVLMLSVIGDRDLVVSREAPIAIFRNVPQVPVENREIILLHSDDHGHPRLRALHSAAASPGFEWTSASGRFPRLRARKESADALDYYGYWKWFDALTDAAFFGLHREYGLGGTFEQTHMGIWSDGTPVRPAEMIVPR